MSTSFRDLLKLVGSGQHTSKHLTRSEAAQATRMMLLGEATPAQIGAFLIAHRIKRPTPDELAGMLDAYDDLGPQLPVLDLDRPLAVFGHPYDGRSRTAPVAPLVALLLATVGSPNLLHGSDRCPTKYGLPLVELWRQLGVDWTKLTLDQVARCLEQVGIGFIYLPRHYPQAQTLMIYRDQIGKRPPLATLELIWAPYNGPFHLICGFVHPPTEASMIKTFELRQVKHFTTVKGLEGSCDLARDRTAILSEDHHRVLLKARDYQLAGSEVGLESVDYLVEQVHQCLQGHPSELEPAILWCGGYYLYRLGHTESLAVGIELAQDLLRSGKVLSTLQKLQAATQH